MLNPVESVSGANGAAGVGTSGSGSVGSVYDPRAERALRDALRRRAIAQDKFATGVLTVIIALVLAIVGAMVLYILFEGVGTLVQPGFLTERARANGTAGGVAYQLFDSFFLLVLTLLISVPVSLGAAVFLVEYAPDGPVKRIASTAVETLSSLPSIVVGMFGFLVFSVGFAMGLTRWEATVHVLIPSAMSAIVTGVVLSAGRVFGEAAALLFTSGMSSPVRLNFLSLNFNSPSCAWNIFRPGESLAVHIYKIYGEGSAEAQQIVWGTAALLMICVLIFNVAARIAGRAISRKVTGQ